MAAEPSGKRMLGGGSGVYTDIVYGWVGSESGVRRGWLCLTVWIMTDDLRSYAAALMCGKYQMTHIQRSLHRAPSHLSPNVA